MEGFSKGKRIECGANDFKQKIRLSFLRENGFILFNNAVSLAIILIMLSAIGTCVFWTMQKSKEIKANLELSRELSYVMERITEDMNLADRVKLDHNVTGDIIFIEYRTKPKDSFSKISYGKADASDGKTARIFADGLNAPITGDSELGKVHITNFNTKKLSEHLVLVELEGTSKVTRQIYTLKTAVYIQGEIIE